MKVYANLFLIVLFCGIQKVEAQTRSSSIYEYSLPSIDAQKSINFSDFKGKGIVIMATSGSYDSSRQLSNLFSLGNAKKDKNVVFIICPVISNSYQRDLDKQFFDNLKSYQGVNIMVSAPIHVNGEKIHPLFKWIASRTMNGMMNARVIGDHNKFILDQNGVLIGYMNQSQNLDDIVFKRIFSSLYD